MSSQRQLDQERLRRLIEVGRELLAELDPEVVLDRALETARETTGARYAALGVMNVERTGLERFITRGVDGSTQRAIGALPRGRGVLGVLIEDPRPLRLSAVGEHPRSYGFPAGHPPMGNFLGVPILVRGEAWGNLYLTDKPERDFDEADEEAVVLLAQWAGIAIENARLYRASEHRRVELEKALRGLEAARDVAIAIGQESRPERVLELIVKRGRALVEARSVVILLRDGDELVVAAHAGYAADADGARIPIDRSASGDVMRRRRAERISDVGRRLGVAPHELGIAAAQSALLVPLVFRAQALGVLGVFDRGERAEAFSEDDEHVLHAFAAGAATAVATAQTLQDDRLRHSLAAAEAERGRWARELHDETLQGLAALRILLTSVLREGDLEAKDAGVGEAIRAIQRETDNLRAIVSDLRPAALDAFGLRAALETLVARQQSRQDFELVAELSLAEAESDGSRLTPELETTIYRLVQEALTNAIKHAQGHQVRVVVAEIDGQVRVEVADDGVGFAVDADRPGFGLIGMRERVELVGGTLTIDSGPAGTVIRACLPSRRVDSARETDARVEAQLQNSPRRSA